MYDGDRQPGHAWLELELRNAGGTEVAFTITPNDFAGEERTVWVGTGERTRLTWRTDEGRYDVTVTAATGTRCAQRYEGTVHAAQHPTRPAAGHCPRPVGAAGRPDRRGPQRVPRTDAPRSLPKPLSRSKESRQRDSQERDGPSAACSPALSVVPSGDRADAQALPRYQWPIQGRVTDISALCNANRFLGLVSPWGATVWGLGTEPGIWDCTSAPTGVGVHEREVTDSCLFLVRRFA
ncbi:phospholipase domain-containing protein [Streptomyces sp. NPDC046931]|uniref:phospholipase domain-containing protein n=1 Tax=Streptomyces sp. NPDC046931 TaxID=3154806 RepID=UPI00340ECCBA